MTPHSSSPPHGVHVLFVSLIDSEPDSDDYDSDDFAIVSIRRR